MSWLCSFCLAFSPLVTFDSDNIYVAIFVVSFAAFCLLRCLGRFRTLIGLFVLLSLCVTLHIQCLGDVSAHFVLFVFFQSPPRRIWRCWFTLSVSTRDIHVKYRISVPIWALPYQLSVPPRTTLLHRDHPHHPWASVSFRPCVCVLCW